MVIGAVTTYQINYARGKAPALPVFRRATPIELSPVHAIFFGAVLYEIAKELNAHVANAITDNGFMEMAFFYALIPDSHAFRLKNHRFAENRIGRFLSERYVRERKGLTTQAVVQYLSSRILEVASGPATNLWRVALERHTRIGEASRAA